MINQFGQFQIPVCKAPNFSLDKEKLEFGQRKIGHTNFLNCLRFFIAFIAAMQHCHCHPKNKLFSPVRLNFEPQFFYFWSTDYTDSTDFARALLVPIRMAARAQPLAYLFNPCYLLTKKIREICGLD